MTLHEQVQEKLAQAEVAHKERMAAQEEEADALKAKVDGLTGDAVRTFATEIMGLTAVDHYRTIPLNADGSLFVVAYMTDEGWNLKDTPDVLLWREHFEYVVTHDEDDFDDSFYLPQTAWPTVWEEIRRAVKQHEDNVVSQGPATPSDALTIATALRERLADLAHDQWSNWMDYLFSKGVFNEDGTWTMPAEFVTRWELQMETKYAALSEAEQDSDRKEADKFLAVFHEVIRVEPETFPTLNEAIEHSVVNTTLRDLQD